MNNTATLETEAKPLTSFASELFAPADAERAAKEPVLAKAMAETQKPTAGEPKPTTPPTIPPKPAVATTAPTTATEPDIDAEIESGKRTPKADDWKRMKQGFKAREEEYQGKLSGYEAKLAELEKAPVHNAKIIAELTAERDRYKTIHDQVLLTQLPEFHQQYRERLNGALSPLKALLPEADAGKLSEALLLPDGQHKREILSGLMSELDDWTKGEIIAANGKVREIMNERDSRIAKANETLDVIVKDRAQQQKAAEETAGKVFDTAVQRIQDKAKGMPIMQPREGEGAEDWNRGVKQRIEMARHIYRGDLSPEERADAAFWAASGEALLKELAAANRELETLRQSVGRLQGSTPAITGDTTGKTISTAEASRPFSSQYGKWIKEAGGQ